MVQSGISPSRVSELSLLVIVYLFFINKIGLNIHDHLLKFGNDTKLVSSTTDENNNSIQLDINNINS